MATPSAPALPRQQRLERVERVGFRDRLVVAPAQHAGKADGDAALVALARRDALEAKLEHLRRCEASNRTEGLERGAADDRVHLADFLVRQARIGLGERHQLARAGLLARAPDGE